MPNHVSNEIKIIGPEARIRAFFEQAKATVVDEHMITKVKTLVEREFSFRGFVTPPDHPDYDSGGCSHSHFQYRRGIGGADPNPNCWYAWNPDNWGTKWDAYSVKIGGEQTVLDRLARAGDDEAVETVKFETAWSPPFPVFEKIAELYPDCRFEFRWMNEDSWGAGGGYAKAENGEMGEVTDGINDPDDDETRSLWFTMMRELRGWSHDMIDEVIAEHKEDERLTAEAAAKEAASG